MPKLAGVLERVAAGVDHALLLLRDFGPDALDRGVALLAFGQVFELVLDAKA